MTATLWMSQPHQSAWHHNLPAVYSALPKADLHRTNMSECEECEQLMSGKTALNKSVVICKSFFPSSSSLYDHGCVISVAYSGSPIWICRAKLERGARSWHIYSWPLWRYCRPCNTQSKLTKHKEGSNTHTHRHTLKLGCNQGTTTNRCRGRLAPVSSHLSKAWMQTNRKIKDNFVPKADGI